MQSINPFSETIIAKYTAHSDQEINNMLDQSVQSFLLWKKTSLEVRALYLEHVADLLEKEKLSLATLITNEMGKLNQEAIVEIEKCARVCRYYAEHGTSFLRKHELASEAKHSYAAILPLGPVLAIMPWNFPFWQVFRFVAPAMMAGNVALLKHASNVTGCALVIENIFKKACEILPKKVSALLQVVKIPGKEMSALIKDARVKAVTLTGSTEAGRQVAEIAGQSLKKTVLELGGSDPYLILEDADVKKSAKLCVKSRLLNAGQSCIAAKRFIVLDAIYEEWLSLFCQHMKANKLGDPMDPTTSLAPLAAKEFCAAVHKQVQLAIEQGAHCILGGHRPEQQGFFYTPTVLVDVTPEMSIYSQELFGPVAMVFRVKNIAEAVKLANATCFGLGAGIFSENISLAEEIALNDLEAGSCFVNSFVASHPNLPFGGIKESGYGRELSMFGMHEFVNIKTIAIY